MLTRKQKGGENPECKPVNVCPGDDLADVQFWKK
jgi:hypothetical protein